MSTATGTIGDHRGWYALLGVEPSADESEIRRAYKAAARRWHPDVNPSPDAAEMMRELNEAVSVLTDPLLREEYDGTAAPVDHGITFDPQVADLGERRQGSDACVTVAVHCVTEPDDIDIDRLAGAWWSAELKVPDRGSALVEIVFTGDTRNVGTFDDEIVLTAGDTRHRLHLRMSVLPATVFARAAGGVKRRATSGVRSLRRSARRMRVVNRNWESLAADYVRFGLLLCLLWGFLPQLVTHSYGIISRIVGVDVPTLFAVTEALVPWGTGAGIVLFVVTLGAKKAGTFLRVLSVLVATTGWVIGILCALWLAALVIYVAAIIAAIVLAFSVLLS